MLEVGGPEGTLPPDEWFDGASRPIRPPSPEVAELPQVDTLDGLTEVPPSSFPVLLRGLVDGRQTTFLDYPYPANRSGRKRCDVGRILAAGPVGDLLVRAVVRQCAGKSAGGWKVHLRAVIALVGTIVREDGILTDADALPADLLERLEERYAARTGALSEADAGYLRAAARIVRRMPGADHVRRACGEAGAGRRDHVDPAADRELPTDIEIEDLLRHVMRRVLETMRADEQIREAIEGRVIAGPLPAGIAEGAAWLRSRHPAGPPRLATVRLTDAEVGAALSPFWKEVRRAAYPSSVDMAPFMVLLAFYTRLNPSLMCGLRTDQIVRTSFLGRERGAIDARNGGSVEFSPSKPRQNRDQYVGFAVTDEVDNPANLVSFVERWTAGIRGAAGKSAGRLFIFAWQRAQNGGVGDFVYTANEFALRMRELCRAAGIRAMTPKQLRPAAIDTLFATSGGDMALVRAAGWWKDVETPERVYFGPRTRRRGEEDLAFLRLLEDRRRRHGIDVANRPSWMDRGAATPGWTCYDPFSGPLPGRRGELCSAIGHCPICPNADVDERAPEVFSHVVALGLRLLKKREDMPEEGWRAQWEPVLDALVTDWLPLFDEATIDAARVGPAVEIEDFG